ncbi:putative L-ascorbate oxidase [Podospora australis]|uniref:L-ascorbate oxidase n=1 Tax=Podospora australis TaxID=1536484 RepID=A0AAN7AJ03_9PEZI|nr:putative L-ascorbate oxidase [Podospora australis]
MRATTLSSLLLGSCLSVGSVAQLVVHDDRFVPDHILRVSVASVPSACESRTDILVNGTTPGPALHILPGSRSWIRVYNDMADHNLTMHWHGLTQRMAPFADGTPLASQWPIPPGYFFDYELATNNDDAGTYFYHSHVEMQALSCTGPLIVDDCGGSPYQYDDERILQFQDFFQKSDDEMLKGVTNSSFQWTGETHGILLNGKGVATGHSAVTGPPGGLRGFFGGRLGVRPDGFRNTFRNVHRRQHSYNDTSDQNHVEPTDACTLPVIDVLPGKKYRFRFIGSTGLSFLTMGIEGHRNLIIVQADGSEYNAPVRTDHIQLGAGQRFDVLFKTKTAQELASSGNKTTFYIQFETLERPEPYRGYAVLRYSPHVAIPTAPAQPVLSLPTDPTTWMEYALTPLFPAENEAPSAEEVTRRIIIDAEQKQDNKTGKVIWELAHLSWTEFSYQRPLLVDIYQHGQGAIPDYDAAMKNYGWDPKKMAFPCKIGEVLEIVFQNTGSQFVPANGLVEMHPFHAHSKHYYDIGSGPGLYDADANNAKLAKTGYKSVKRDTTMLYRYESNVAPGQAAGWRAWRIKITDSGVWMIHCHILAHMMMGMQSVWVMGDADDIKKIPVTVADGYYTYGGSVYGNVTHAPAVYHYFNGTNQCARVRDE